MQQTRHSVKLDQTDDVRLVCKALQSLLKLPVLGHALFAVDILEEAPFKTATEGAQKVLDQVGAIVGRELLFSLNRSFELSFVIAGARDV